MKHLLSVKGDSSKFWRFLNSSFFRIKGTQISQIISNNSVLEGIPAANAVNDYFWNISKVLSEKFAASKPYDTEISCEFSCTEVPQLSVRQVTEAINKIDRNKSSGIPGLPAKLLKTALHAMPIIFTALLNLCLTNSVFLEPWKLAQVVCLPKGGDTRNPCNIRPNSLLLICGKILESFLND